MIDRESIENLSDSECVELMTQLVHRLNLTAYGRGYKDGFNDGMDAELQKQVYQKAVERTKKNTNKDCFDCEHLHEAVTDENNICYSCKDKEHWKLKG